MQQTYFIYILFVTPSRLKFVSTKKEMKQKKNGSEMKKRKDSRRRIINEGRLSKGRMTKRRCKN